MSLVQIKSIFKDSSYFYRYLFSYIVILLLPITIMSLIIFNQVVGSMMKETARESQAILSSLQEGLDVKFAEFSNIVSQISLNANINGKDLNTPLRRMRAIQELRNYTIGNSFIYDLVLSIKDNDYLYATTSTYTVDSFFNGVYNYEKWGETDFLKCQELGPMISIKPAQNVTTIFGQNLRMVTIIKQIPSLTKPDAMAMFMISEKSLRQLLASKLGEYDGNVFLFNGNGEMIVSLYDDKQLDMTSLIQDINISENETILLDGTKYLKTSHRSQYLDLYLVSIIPEKELMKNVTAIKTDFLIGVTIIIFIGSILIYLITKSNYNPLKKLKQIALKTIANGQRNNNEYELVQNAVSYLLTTNENLNERIVESHFAIRENLLLNLITGNIKDLDTLNANGKEVGITFKFHQYFVICIYFSNHKSTELSGIKANTMNYFRNRQYDKFEIYIKDSQQEDVLIIIASTQSGHMDEITEMVDKIHIDLSRRQNISLVLGVGNVYCNLAGIRNSYVEALLAIDFRLVKGIDEIIYYRDIQCQEGNHHYYPSKQMEEIKVAIQQGDEIKAFAIMDAILVHVKQADISLFIIKSLCYNMINIFITYYYEILHEYSVVDSENCPKPDFEMTSFMTFETIDELFAMIKNSYKSLLSYVDWAKKFTSKDLINKIVDYIDHNFSDYNFTVKKTADAFNMPLSSLSNYFRNNTGETIMSYVNNLRMHQTKHLLISTNLSVQTIANQVGYSDLSNFIRKFKHYSGCTPGEYRMTYKANEISKL